MRPVINATARLVMKPFELGEWRVPPGPRVVTGIALMHHDDRFHERARRFDPDRYVGKKPDTYAWIPFGGGVRRCLGAAFAQFEIDIVLRTLLRNFELQPTTRRASAKASAASRSPRRKAGSSPCAGGLCRSTRAPRQPPSPRPRGSRPPEATRDGPSRPRPGQAVAVAGTAGSAEEVTGSGGKSHFHIAPRDDWSLRPPIEAVAQTPLRPPRRRASAHAPEPPPLRA